MEMSYRQRSGHVNRQIDGSRAMRAEKGGAAQRTERGRGERDRLRT